MRWPALHCALASVVCLIASLPPAAPAAEPFYEDLLRRGIAAADAGDHATAARQLRIACFGLLDEPPRLAAGLTYLALSQAALERDDDVRATAERVLDLERRFGAWSDAELAPETRRAFVAEVSRRLPYERLRQLPAFAEATRTRLAAELAELAPARRRQRLARLLQLEPTHPPWVMMMAELELVEGHPEASLELLAPLLAEQPEHAAARCLNGYAAALTGRCDAALADLPACAAPPADESVAERLIH
ncbi:MAG: hypothetical protein D6696_16200, partial [Acidobacteria bacterium]